MRERIIALAEQRYLQAERTGLTSHIPVLGPSGGERSGWE
jgi:hypothetical protein